MKKILLLMVCLIGSLSVSASQAQPQGQNKNILALNYLMAAQSGLLVKSSHVDSVKNKAMLSSVRKDEIKINNNYPLKP